MVNIFYRNLYYRKNEKNILPKMLFSKEGPNPRYFSLDSLGEGPVCGVLVKAHPWGRSLLPWQSLAVPARSPASRNGNNPQLLAPLPNNNILGFGPNV